MGKSRRYGTVYFWYQYIGPNYPAPVDVAIDPAQHPVSYGRTFAIEAMSDLGGSTTWLLWADGILLASIAATDLGWTGGGQYGSNVQWSGEVSYFESEMGGPASNPVRIVYPMWYPGGQWDYIYDPYTFNSWHPRYSGDAVQYSDGTWRFRNWTYSNFLFLPLILKNH